MTSMDDGWTEVGALDELPEGKGRAVRVGDEPMVLVRSGEQVFALSDVCTHQGAQLHGGAVKTASPATITCPFHGSIFRLEDGRVMRGPATRALATYEVRIEDGSVAVRPAR
jgi:nitrite reductase/ring-hydroxylating ferredoxin subunit